MYTITTNVSVIKYYAKCANDNDRSKYSKERFHK